MFARVMCVVKKFFHLQHAVWMFYCSHALASKHPDPPFQQLLWDVWGQRWLLQSPSLIRTWHFLHHLSRKAIKKGRLVESYSVQLASSGLKKGVGSPPSLKFLPQHLSLTLMSRLSWSSTSPGAKITHIPKAATGGREADPKTKEEGWKKKYI